MKTRKNISVVIMDDDKVLGIALKKSLESNFPNYQLDVSAFETGEAFEKGNKKHPDVAIIDYRLNSERKDAMNGIRIINQLKKNSPETEVIMLTGEDSAAIAAKAMQLGAHDYLLKDETMMHKLTVSLTQCIRLREVRQEVKGQRVRGLIALLLLTIVFGVVGTLQVIAPGLLGF